MKRRRKRFGDITVHEKAYMGGILYGKKTSRMPEPLPDKGALPLAGRMKEITARHWWVALAAAGMAVATGLVVMLLPSYRQVFVQDEQMFFAYQTSADTVDDFLQDSGIELNGGDALNVLPQEPIEEGMRIEINRPKPVTIIAGSQVHFISLSTGTVKDALEQARLEYDAGDEISPTLEDPISEGLQIVLQRVDVRYETETVAIPFKTVTQNDPTLEKGKTQVKTQGSNGEKAVTVRIEMRDGEEIAREEVSQQVILQPVNKVIRNGVKVAAPKPTPAAVSAFGLRNDNRKAKAPPKAAEIGRTVKVEATAYTHTGKKTATGTMPKVGTVAVNPKQIPYGSVLYIEGYGYGIAEDTGAFRHYDRFQIDLFMDTERECIKWGRKRNVTVYILK